MFLAAKNQNTGQNQVKYFFVCNIKRGLGLLLTLPNLIDDRVDYLLDLVVSQLE